MSASLARRFYMRKPADDSLRATLAPSPAHRRAASPAAYRSEIDRKDQQANRQHPDAEDRQEAEDAPRHESCARGDARGTGSGQAYAATENFDRIAAQPDIAAAFSLFRVHVR